MANAYPIRNASSRGFDPEAGALDPMGVVYDELRILAEKYLSQERPDHTLQATALVHEAYLRLKEIKHLNLENVPAFCAAAAGCMRRVLVDHARRHKRDKRGGGKNRQPLHDNLDAIQCNHDELIGIDEALSRLSHDHPRRTQIVELKFFAGCKNEEVAHILGISRATVEREWKVTRAWLYGELTRSGAVPDAADDA